MTDRQSAAQIEEEAARWVMRGDREGETEQHRLALEAWFAGDVRRRGAYLQLQAVWADLDQLERTTTVLAATPAGQDAQDGRAVAGMYPDRRLVSRRWWIGGASAVAAASAGAVFLTMSSATRYSTAIGEVRRLPLPDRSTMAINSASRVEVAYADNRREVTIEAGEAWFQVAKDRDRPFVVSAGRVRVQAVGTAFSVRRRDGGVEVMVTEGVVEVWVAGSGARPIAVAAGSATFVEEATGTLQPDGDDAAKIARRLAWRSGQLDLAGETLGEAIGEFNRHSPAPIMVEGTELEDKRLYGIFRLDDPGGFARSAALTLGASVRQDGAVLVIYSDKTRKTPTQPAVSGE